MRGTGCVDLVVAEAAEPAAQVGVFGDAGWWRVVLDHAMPPGESAAFVTVRAADRVIASVPMARSGRRLRSLTTPYSCVYQPDCVDPAMRLAALTAFGRFCRRAGDGVTRLDALPAEWDGLADLTAGARRVGLVPLRFDHFGNWYEDVAGLDWAAYLAARPGALRETIKRRMRRAEKLPSAAFSLLTAVGEMDRAAAAFESVYRRSWKEPEPYPTFNVALMRAMAASGRLRLGVWSVGAVDVAVQMWVVADGAAIVLKLAHDEAFKAHSPGTVLTALMVRHLLDRERVAVIDFGRGDDEYKQGWVAHRRQRIGVLLVDPRRLAGMAVLARHALGRLRDWRLRDWWRPIG
jgi:CelD/BcsL family acetyltransferase involved in cellulose biosynthesis